MIAERNEVSNMNKTAFDSEMAVKEKEMRFIGNAEASMICDICRGVWFPPNW